MLTNEELDASCKRNDLTCLICGQGYFDTLNDVKADDPDIDDDDIPYAVMERMLDENLNYGSFAEQDDEDDDTHSKNMSIRCDICESVAAKWVNGEFTGKDKPELTLAQEYADELVQKLEKK